MLSFDINLENDLRIQYAGDAIGEIRDDFDCVAGNIQLTISSDPAAFRARITTIDAD
jgi:hypothetical protein